MEQSPAERLPQFTAGDRSPADQANQAAAFAHQKIESRLRLLELPPAEAQALVEQTLYPQLWECHVNDHPWAESLPSHYGETNP